MKNKAAHNALVSNRKFLQIFFNFGVNIYLLQKWPTVLGNLLRKCKSNLWFSSSFSFIFYNDKVFQLVTICHLVEI